MSNRTIWRFVTVGLIIGCFILAFPYFSCLFSYFPNYYDILVSFRSFLWTCQFFTVSCISLAFSYLFYFYFSLLPWSKMFYVNDECCGLHGFSVCFHCDGSYGLLRTFSNSFLIFLYYLSFLAVYVQSRSCASIRTYPQCFWVLGFLPQERTTSSVGGENEDGSRHKCLDIIHRIYLHLIWRFWTGLVLLELETGFRLVFSWLLNKWWVTGQKSETGPKSVVLTSYTCRMNVLFTHTMKFKIF